MDVRYRILIVIIIGVILTVSVIVWLWYRNPPNLLEWWNLRIRDECDAQDLNPLNGIPSYYDAAECGNPSATSLHNLIALNHDDIIAEVREAIRLHNGITLEDIDVPWLDIHDTSNRIWIKFMGEWSGAADRMPTLKRIASLFPDVPTLYISLFEPGLSIINHRGPSRATKRYEYGLEIADDDVGLNIAGYDVKWQQRGGFIWDDTLPHSVWNHTRATRVTISAHVMRNLSTINNIGTHMVYRRVKKNPHVLDVQRRLHYEGVVVQ